MFYLTKRTDEKQCTPGDRVMLLADLPSWNLAAGMIGRINNVHEGGLAIEWAPFITDGFGREDMDKLAFATLGHPSENPEVYNEKIQR